MNRFRQSAANFLRTAGGLLARNRPDGPLLFTLPQAPALQTQPPSPWNVTTELVEGNLLATVRPGYVDGHAPAIGGVAIDYTTPPTLTVTQTGTRHIYLKLTLTLTSANGYVYAAEYDESEILEGSSIPDDDTENGYYYARIATFVDGVKQTPQPMLSNLQFYIEADGSGDAKAVCRLHAA